MLRIAQGEFDGSFSQETFLRTHGFGCVWITASAFLFGLIAFWSGQSWLLSFFVPAAYSAFLFTFVRILVIWRDLFNPLCLVLTVGFIRFLLPGILILSGREPREELLVFQLMQISGSDWEWGNSLALLGMLAVVLGWFLMQMRPERQKRLTFDLSDSVKYASLAGMLVGFMALLAFVMTNASLGVIMSGAFRGTIIQEGTGKYFFSAYFLISGSVLLASYFIAQGRIKLAIVPLLVSAILYWVLGGRNRALTPLACGLLMCWYFQRERNAWGKLPVSPAHLAGALFVVICVVWLAYVGQLYRGESGAGAFSEGLSLTGFLQYLEDGIYTDLGQLHSLAGAIAIGPGVLAGYTFIGSLGWPLSKVLPLPGRSAGVFIVEELLGFGKNQERWGFNASLIGDAYLNFGLGGVAIVMLLFGALLKMLYWKFRHGSLHGAIYTIAILSSIQAFWVSIEVWPQALTTLGSAVFLMALAKTVLRVQSATTSR